MNCKPGDLAIVVRVNQRRFEWAIGRLVRVTKIRHNRRTGVPCWDFDGGRLYDPSGDYDIVGFDDDELKPIRDPGDDAQDESFRWAPAPEKATV
jgi:hypothetical protein